MASRSCAKTYNLFDYQMRMIQQIEEERMRERKISIMVNPEEAGEAMKGIMEKMNQYDQPIATNEFENRKLYTYELIGLGREDIEVKTEFINKTKETFIVVTGKHEFPDLDFDNDINIRLKVDTNVYERFDWDIFNGMLVIDVYEKINEVPKFYDSSTNVDT